MIAQTQPTLIKSKQRVQEHGEVFTPQWVVDKMVTIPEIHEKTEDIFATFLEPSAGEGAFLLAVENLKLRCVTDNYYGDMWTTYALWALTSIYGIEYLEDNIAIARQNLLDLFTDYYTTVHNVLLPRQDDIYKSARTIIWANVVQGNALTRLNKYDEDIMFSNWIKIPKSISKVKRKPFTYLSLYTNEDNNFHYVQSSLFGDAEMQHFGAASSLQYAVVDINHVWKEELLSV